MGPTHIQGTEKWTLPPGGGAECAAPARVGVHGRYPGCFLVLRVTRQWRRAAPWP